MTFLPQNQALKKNAKMLRRQMTKEECHLWFDFLRAYPVKILRQKIIANYIVDFYCEKARLAIEVDGSQHYEPLEREKDERRTKNIEAFGVKVVRFTNKDIHERFDGVKEAIHQQIQARQRQKRQKQPTTAEAVPRPSKGGQGNEEAEAINHRSPLEG